MTDSTPGWQPDPTGKHDHRYWDGSQWTENVSDAGVASTDPYEPSASAPDETVVATPTEPEAPAAGDATVASPAPPPPDVTAAWPAAPAAPGAPAAPPPYVPTSPVSAGGGGSKKGLLIGGGILAVVIAVIAFVALSGDDDDTDVRAQLASTLERESGLSASDAECVADFFVDDLGEDAFEGVDFSAADPPEELQDAFIESGVKAVEECDLDESAFGSDGSTDSSDEGTDDTDSTDAGDEDLQALRDDCADGDFKACDDLYFGAEIGSDLEEFGSTCGGIADKQDGFCVETDGGQNELSDGGATDLGSANFEEILADTYEEMFDLSRDQAECLADRLATAIDEGELDEEEAMTNFFDYLSDCDISLEEIGAN